MDERIIRLKIQTKRKDRDAKFPPHIFPALLLFFEVSDRVCRLRKNSHGLGEHVPLGDNFCLVEFDLVGKQRFCSFNLRNVCKLNFVFSTRFFPSLFHCIFFCRSRFEIGQDSERFSASRNVALHQSLMA